jgi:hypothetical protein
MDLFKQIAEVSPTILLSFSLGKDSIGAWLALHESGLFKQIIPFYGYLVPGLRFVDESIAYYEDFFKTKIYQYPSPNFYRMLKSGTMMPLWNTRFMREIDIDTNWNYEDLADIICEDRGLDEDTFVATGIRAIDNMTRLAAMKRSGPITWNLLKFHPIWDWNKNMLMTRIHRAEVNLPADYLAFGRSYDGLDRRFLGPIKSLWPDDYKRIREYFPLVDAVLWRERYARRHRF